MTSIRRSYASVVGGVAKAGPRHQAPEIKRLCTDCGSAADICHQCKKLAVYDRGLCGRCFSSRLDSESMCMGYVRASEAAETIPFQCAPCRARRPWHWEDDKEVVEYRYVPMCFCHPLSPSNVIRIAQYRRRGTAADPSKREEEAMAAFNKEMRFSGNAAEALTLYTSFYKGAEAGAIKLKSNLGLGTVPHPA